MQLVLVSACLLGERVRYHGGHAFKDDPHLAAWVRQGRVRALCPEVMAGLGTPREPAEIEGGAGGRRVLDKTARVLARSGRDVTSEFAVGANAAVELARTTAAQVAVLEDGSPSCGSQYIADGAFAGRRVMHEGVAAAALRAIGLAVFNEHQIEQASRIVALLDSGLSIEMAKRAAAADSAADWCIWYATRPKSAHVPVEGQQRVGTRPTPGRVHTAEQPLKVGCPEAVPHGGVESTRCRHSQP